MAANGKTLCYSTIMEDSHKLLDNSTAVKKKLEQVQSEHI